MLPYIALLFLFIEFRSLFLNAYKGALNKQP